MIDCRVVLVRPKFAGNLGATARVMRNFGLSQLVLVAPEADPNDPQARQMSTHGEEILRQARIVARLEEALAECVLVAGTSARVGGPVRRQSVGPPDEIMPQVVEVGRRAAVALVFGPEPSGLTDAEVTRCHHLIHIPVDAGYPALNLAQAVAICLYELHRAGRRGEAAVSTSPKSPPPAPFAAQDRMFADLRAALEEIHFLYGGNADALMHAVRHLIARAGPTQTEVDILMGLARQMRWIARQRTKSEGEEV